MWVAHSRLLGSQPRGQLGGPNPHVHRRPPLGVPHRPRTGGPARAASAGWLPRARRAPAAGAEQVRPRCVGKVNGVRLEVRECPGCKHQTLSCMAKSEAYSRETAVICDTCGAIMVGDETLLWHCEQHHPIKLERQSGEGPQPLVLWFDVCTTCATGRFGLVRAQFLRWGLPLLKGRRLRKLGGPPSGTRPACRPAGRPPCRSRCRRRPRSRRRTAPWRCRTPRRRSRRRTAPCCLNLSQSKRRTRRPRRPRRRRRRRRHRRRSTRSWSRPRTARVSRRRPHRR